MKIINSLYFFIAVILLAGCAPEVKEIETVTIEEEKFVYHAERFSDLNILRYEIPGFEELDLKQKELLYYLYEAALSGRDILWDQNYKHNLYIRRTLETIVNSYNGDRETEEFQKFMEYTKRVWFSNGIHHHYSTQKILPEFSIVYFAVLLKYSDENEFPLQEDESVDDLFKKLTLILFDPRLDAKRVNLDPSYDLVTESANNFYEGVTQEEVETFYSKLIDKSDPTPISYGLNSKLIKEDGVIREKVWKVGGMYTDAIEKIIYWLEKASAVAENEYQKDALDKLIEYYKTGDLRKFDEYNIAWVKDTASMIDVINGFIEVYGDPIGYRGSFESVVSFKDMEATKRIAAISREAQWFEDNSPLMENHKKKNVVGISAKVITVVAESGDSSPSTPIGINLPNANWIRKQYGSKSVNMGNIVHAYIQAREEGGGSLEEFAYTQKEIDRTKEYGALAGNLHTDLHEVIGHASGQINKGVGTPKETLKSYASTLEEARADLVALYYIMDEKMVEIGVMPNLEVGEVEYDGYIRNGLLTQLTRIKLGDNIEQAHMRNRQLVTKWVYERGRRDNVIERIVGKNGNTYFVINDYKKLRELFGQLMREIQRIKSEGDYESGNSLVENYGVKVDRELHKEVLERYKKLNIAPYAGFINPILTPVHEGDEIIDVKIEYPDDFTEQMLYYTKKYSFLPTYN